MNRIVLIFAMALIGCSDDSIVNTQNQPPQPSADNIGSVTPPSFATNRIARVYACCVINGKACMHIVNYDWIGNMTEEEYVRCDNGCVNGRCL